MAEAEAEQPALSTIQEIIPNAVAGVAPSSKLPSALQLPLAVTLSFAMASIGYNLLGEFSKGDLAAVSRSQDTWAEVGILAGWRL